MQISPQPLPLLLHCSKQLCFQTLTVLHLHLNSRKSFGQFDRGSVIFPIVGRVDMAHDFSKTDKTPFEIAQRRGRIVNTDLAPILTNVQVLSDAFAGPFRPRQFFFESDGRAEHHGSRVADDLVAIITKQFLHAPIPSKDDARWVEHENRVSPHAFHQHAIALLALR